MQPSDSTKGKRLCAVCGKECDQSERTTDGTYLHTSCAMRVAPAPMGKGEKGSGVYGGP